MTRKFNKFVSGRFWTPFYEGEGGTTDPGTSPPPPPTSPPPPPPAAILPGAFTPAQQQRVNELLAAERRKTQEAAQQQNQKTIQELERLQQNQSLTQQERDNLTAQIEELKTQFQTKEQQAQTEYTKLQKKYNDETQTLTKDRDTWKGRFEDRVKRVDIRDASRKHNAIDDEQIEAILLPKTQVVEEMAEGKPTGNLISRVKFTGKDKDGKPVVLELSPDDAVKAMKEWPEKYGNLFKSDARGGIGANPNGTPVVQAGAIGNLETMSPQDYLKNRSKIREQIAKSTQ